MALLNPPELRPSLLVLITAYLARCRGQRDDVARLVATTAPQSLSKDGKHQLDVRLNLTAAIELGLIERSDDEVRLAEHVAAAMKKQAPDVAALIRARVLAPEMNTASWGQQTGARDLTNALAWFLTFSANAAPASMETKAPTAKDLQTADFGSRQRMTTDDTDDDAGGWPISNGTRWNAFRRWAPSLGFAWVAPSGRLMPDPTPAVRACLKDVFGADKEVSASEFVTRLGAELPVLETGAYRRLVEENWKRPAPDAVRLSEATTDALERLQAEGRITLSDRADADRVARSDGSTFSHVRKGGR